MKITIHIWTSITACCAAALFVGCSTHSMWIIGDTATMTGTAGAYPEYSRKVFFTDKGLPDATKFEIVGTIDAGKVTTANTEQLLILMADKCRERGANAVIHLNTWRQASGWTWSGPHGSGTAVRVADTNALAGFKGYWY
jgi:hypothetical protein